MGAPLCSVAKVSRGKVPEEDGLRAMVETAFAETAGSVGYFHDSLLVKMPGSDDASRRRCAVLPRGCRAGHLYLLWHEVQASESECQRTFTVVMYVCMALHDRCAHRVLMVAQASRPE